MTAIQLSNGEISVEIATLGAELQSLKDAAGAEWLWQADPAVWGRHAPILFPVVGRAANDQIRHAGVTYPLGQHGFARDREFEIVAQTPTSLTLRTGADEATRQVYPFDFELDMHYALDGRRLRQVATVRNPATEVLPASFGYHPGFAWPLPGTEAAQTDHVILFPQDEPADVRRLANGRVSSKGRPTPVVGRTLQLDPALFAEDALIFDALTSRSLWFGVPGKAGMGVGFPDLPFLGLWMKPGAPYLCIEPWQGHHAPEGFDGDIEAMPGMMLIPPGGSEQRHMSVEIGVPAP